MTERIDATNLASNKIELKLKALRSLGIYMNYSYKANLPPWSTPCNRKGSIVLRTNPTTLNQINFAGTARPV